VFRKEDVPRIGTDYGGECIAEQQSKNPF